MILFKFSTIKNIIHYLLHLQLMKTIYFLGSGFSKAAGGLVQKEIIKIILDEGFTQGKEHLKRTSSILLKTNCMFQRIIFVVLDWKMFLLQ